MASNYHVFFTANHIESCIQHGRFGATSVNSLANVKKGDKAFLYDGKKSLFYGPFVVESENQFYEVEPIYGLNARNLISYPNRIAMRCDNTKVVDYVKVFSYEREPQSEHYLMNRILMSTIIENKQVHSTPLTAKEGEYLEKLISQLGEAIENNEVKSFSHLPLVITHVVANGTSISEAMMELLLMENGFSFIHDDSGDRVIHKFNQFVLGYQRQLDILLIGEDFINVIELKKKSNLTDPFTQVREYRDFLESDYRMHTYGIDNKKIKLTVILEKGNRFLENANLAGDDIDLYQFTYTKNDLKLEKII